MKGLILFSYNMLEKRSHLPYFYEHLFHGRVPQGYVENKMSTYERFGVTDPLTHYTLSIVRALTTETLRVYHGCKHSTPFVEDAVAQAVADGCEQVYTLALSPFISKTGTISYEQKVQKYLRQHAPHIEMISLNGYSIQQAFITLLVTRLEEAMHYIDHPTPTIIFTSHSLPGTEQSNSDFIRQYEALAAEVMHKLQYAYRYRLAYRSVGPASQKWLRPDIYSVIDEEYARGTEAIVVCELLSIVENMEVIEEIGQQANERAHMLGMEFIQMRYLNDSYEFVSFLKQLIKEH